MIFDLFCDYIIITIILSDHHSDIYLGLHPAEDHSRRNTPSSDCSDSDHHNISRRRRGRSGIAQGLTMANDGLQGGTWRRNADELHSGGGRGEGTMEKL